MGLRESKKLKLVATVQREALRLFAQQGFELTTVEQIAAASEISTTTFYRYFTSKEDVVLISGRSPGFDAVLDERPPDEPLTDAIRNAVVDFASAVVEPDRVDALARIQLIVREPSLRVAFTEQRQGHAERLAAVLAKRCGRAKDEFQLRLAAGLVIEAMNEAIGYWADHESSLVDLIGVAMSGLQPALESLLTEPGKLR